MFRDQKNKYPEAIEDYTKYIAMKPANAQAYHLRAISRLKNADKQGACEDFRKATELNYVDSFQYLKDNCQ